MCVLGGTSLLCCAARLLCCAGPLISTRHSQQLLHGFYDKRRGMLAAIAGSQWGLGLILGELLACLCVSLCLPDGRV
jgi:hypothetical protein